MNHGDAKTWMLTSLAHPDWQNIQDFISENRICENGDFVMFWVLDSGLLSTDNKCLNFSKHTLTFLLLADAKFIQNNYVIVF